MLLLLILLVQWRVTSCMSSPTLEDNMLPTDEEVIRDLINLYRGQPEEEITLNLPTDEEAFNEIKPMLQAGPPFYYTGGGNSHFVSSSFPEVDARGFHESVFQNLDDFYLPLQRGKKYDPTVSVRARGFYGDVFTDGFGSFHPVKRSPKYIIRNKFLPNQSSKNFRELIEAKLIKNRKKRSVTSGDSSPMHSVNAAYSHPQNERTLQTRTCLVENDTENCEVKLRIVLKNDLDKDKFWQIINFNKDSEEPSNDTSNRVFTSERRMKRSPKQLNSQYGPNFWRNYPDLFFHLLKVNRYRKRKPESSIHGDVFQSGFGDFETLKKRKPEHDMSGLEQGVFNDFGGFDTLRKRAAARFHGDVFSDEFGDFETLKKRVPDHFHHNDVFNDDFGNFQPHRKRLPEGVNFNGDAFNRDFGHFNPLKRRDSSQFKRKPDTNFNGDAFYQDFGYFDTVKRRSSGEDVNGDAFHNNFGGFEPLKRRNLDEFEDHFGGALKRKMASLSGDAFYSNFGNFETLKKRKPSGDGFSEDAFNERFANFDTLKKRKPEDINSDASHSNFGNFNPMKRKPSEALSGDAFHSTFGDFETLKKRRSDMSGFRGDDMFQAGFGDFDTMKKRKPDVDFSENAFHHQFGSFDALRKRVPGAHSSALKEDAFTDGFGDFDISKRSKQRQTDGGYEKLTNLVNNYVNSDNFSSKTRNGTDSTYFKEQTNSSVAKN